MQDDKTRELIAALRPIDDDFMRVMFQGQQELTQNVLRIVTGLGDLTLIESETQHDLKNPLGGRSVILDVYARDSQGKLYDLEVQRSDGGAEPRRARFHSAALDLSALEAGEAFSQLPESYVIFITESDMFGKGAGVYRFERADRGTGTMLGDGSHVVYVNGRYRGDNPLGWLMHDFACSDPDDMLDPLMAERTRQIKQRSEGAAEMGKIFDEIRDEIRKEVREEVREEVRQEGREEGRLQMLQDLACEGVLSFAEAAKRAGLTPEQFEQAMLAGTAAPHAE